MKSNETSSLITLALIIGGGLILLSKNNNASAKVGYVQPCRSDGCWRCTRTFAGGCRCEPTGLFGCPEYPWTFDS